MAACVIGLLLGGCGAAVPEALPQPESAGEIVTTSVDPLSIAAPPVVAVPDSWVFDFRSLGGWRDNRQDRTLQSEISSTPDGKARLKEAGSQNWGKACYLIKSLDFDRQPILFVKVSDCTGAKWGLGVAPLAPNEIGWLDDQYKSLVEWQEKPGEMSFDLAQVTGLGGQNHFWIVLLVSNTGQSVFFDSLRIEYAR